MVATLTKPSPKPQSLRHGVWTNQITGRFRPITVHQLAAAWWLYQAKHITARQFRVYFAAHEMHERRRYTKSEEGGRPRTPSYTLDEIKALIGSQAVDADLSADVKALGRLGLVKIGSRSIEFAVSIDQIALDDVAGFWAFFDQLPNSRRKVPMPRRTVRALAKGFTRGVSAMMIAMLIRTLYWHRTGGEDGQGGYRIDGRTKCSWIAEVFGISRRTVTDARAALLELGWITAIDTEQWQLNKWGQRYILNVDEFGPEQQGGSASPTSEISDVSASPCLNKSSPSTKEVINTRRPAPMRSGSTGGSRKERSKGSSPPKLHDIRLEDLRDTGRLLELHRQAIKRGDPVNGEGGRHDFIALAERARRHGDDPPRMFAWLLREGRFDFITHEDEDAAAGRLRELRQGPRQNSRAVLVTRKPRAVELSEDARRYAACIMAAKQKRLNDPFIAARQVFGWTREQWQRAQAEYDQARADRWAQ